MPPPSERIRRTQPALIDTIGRACAARRRRGERVFPLAQAVPGFPPPAPVLEALRASLEDERTHRYTMDPGLPELRAAIAEVLGARRGVRWDPERQILVTAGANLAFAEVLPALIDPGDEVLLLSPYYLNHAMAVELFGGRLVEVPLAAERGFRVDLDALERAVSPRARLLVLVNPSNPIGSVLGQGDVSGLLELARRHDLWVVSDETYEDFVLEPPEDGWASAAAIAGHEDRVVVLGSFSKSAGLAGWRVGWLAGPAPLVDEVLKSHDTMVICAPTAGQRGALASLRGERGWLAPLQTELDRRRRTVLERLESSGILECPPDAARGAMFVLLRPRATRLTDSTATALDIIDKTGVALVPGAAFGAGCAGWLRLSFAAASSPELEAALAALEGYFGDRR
jgi:aspartate/methionine/tyrosine aminotransferase